MVEPDRIYRIQECHVATYHILWDLVHTVLADERGNLNIGSRKVRNRADENVDEYRDPQKAKALSGIGRLVARIYKHRQGRPSRSWRYAAATTAFDL